MCKIHNVVQHHGTVRKPDYSHSHARSVTSNICDFIITILQKKLWQEFIKLPLKELDKIIFIILLSRLKPTPFIKIIIGSTVYNITLVLQALVLKSGQGRDLFFFHVETNSISSTAVRPRGSKSDRLHAVPSNIQHLSRDHYGFRRIIKEYEVITAAVLA